MCACASQVQADSEVRWVVGCLAAYPFMTVLQASPLWSFQVRLTVVENKGLVTAGGCELLISILFCSRLHSFSYMCISLSKMVKHGVALLH